MATCNVSFVDLDGVRHSVQVEGDSLYEAAIKAIVIFRKCDCEPGVMSQLEVEVRTSIVHTLTTKKVRDWLKEGAHTPKEAIAKERLRALLLGLPA
jgi:hypothetical protein